MLTAVSLTGKGDKNYLKADLKQKQKQKKMNLESQKSTFTVFGRKCLPISSHMKM